MASGIELNKHGIISIYVPYIPIYLFSYVTSISLNNVYVATTLARRQPNI